MQRDLVDEYLHEALDAEDSSEKDYHVRQARQLLRAADCGETSESTESKGRARKYSD